jgi:putative redox protein
MSTISVSLEQQSATATLATIRQHEVIVDRPKAKEGTDQGAMGGELLLAALGGCFMSNLLAAIRVRELPIQQVKTVVVGTMAESPSRFQSIELQVSAQCDDIPMLSKVVTIAERGCLVANTLRSAIELKFTIVEYV